MSDPAPPPPCEGCRHYVGVVEAIVEPGGVGLVPICAAFPRGIPRQIRDGRFKHRSSYPGDAGLRFERVKPAR